MAPRRGGAGGAGAEVALGGGRGYFEPPPLKRMQPWQQDGANQCDIIAGGVDQSGIFKGIYVSGVHMAALLRTFQLSKAFMPVDMPQPVAGLGQNLQDGIPIVIVTRGAVGRDLDHGVGPSRNDVQKAIWNTVRQIRADQPMISITCIDLPINCSSDVVQACLEPPLNEYRELMYSDGTWYAPSVTDNKSVASWLSEFRKDRANKKTEGGVKFNRKKFSWMSDDKLKPESYAIGWTKVLEAKPAIAVPKRTDLKFVDQVKPAPKEIKWSGPSAAEATFKKALEKARESGPQDILDAVSAYVKRCTPAYEGETLKSAAEACSEAAGLFTTDADKMKALGLAVSTYLTINAADAAMKVAADAKAGASADTLAKAAKLVMDCHTALGDLDKALEEATAAKAKKASGETCRLVVEAQLAKGEVDAAITAATEAANSSDKKVQAPGLVLVGEAQLAKASQADGKDAYKAALSAAAAAQTKARGVFKELGMTTEEGDALKAAISTLLLNDDCAQALALAKELPGAAGLQFQSLAQVQEFKATGNYLESSESMLSAAKEAVSKFEESSDVAGCAGAQTALAKALLAAEGSTEQAVAAAQSAAQGFKSVGQHAGRLSALLVCAEANIKKGSIYSAYWDAKQAVVEAEITQDSAGYQAASALVAQASSMSEASGKKMSVGGPVGMIADGIVTYV